MTEEATSTAHAIAGQEPEPKANDDWNLKALGFSEEALSLWEKGIVVLSIPWLFHGFWESS